MGNGANTSPAKARPEGHTPGDSDSHPSERLSSKESFKAPAEYTDKEMQIMDVSDSFYPASMKTFTLGVLAHLHILLQPALGGLPVLADLRRCGKWQAQREQVDQDAGLKESAQGFHGLRARLCGRKSGLLAVNGLHQPIY